MSGSRAWLESTLCLAVCLALLGWSRPAFAYCRETTKTKPDGPCVEEPGAELLHWTRGCMTYVFNRDLFDRMPLLDEASVRREFQRSIDAWSAVDCAGTQTPFRVEQSKAVTDTDVSECLEDEPNESVIIARTEEEWDERELGERVIALTVLWHEKNTGEIFDVDMQLNLGMGDFTDCRDKCLVGEVDLRNTITHEAGHLLGLGHTSVLGSTMFDNNATPGDIEKRTLEPDDEAGYCSLNLPEFTCKGANCMCPAPGLISGRQTVTTCGCEVPGARGGRTHAVSAACAAMLLVARRRRRRAG